LALILSNPFAGVQGPGGFKIDVPAVNMPAATKVVTPVVPKKAKDPSGYQLDIDSDAKRRAARAEDALKATKEKKEAEKKAVKAAKAEAAEKKAEAEKKASEAAKAKAAEKKAEAAEKKAEAAEKKALSDVGEKKKASEEAQAKAAEKKAAEEAKAEAAKAAAPAPTPPKSDLVAPAPKTNPAVIKDPNAGGIGVVSGSESGGKVLPKEEISAETLEFLKTYKK
jgi:colicin import membrane protein